MRVALELTKVRRTSHWDMDYLPLAEVEALYGESPPPSRDDSGSKHPTLKVSPRQLGIICIALGAGLLAFAAVAVRFLVR
jgi:hypothetical protein